jgi:hypothetical protein
VNIYFSFCKHAARGAVEIRRLGEFLFARAVTSSLMIHVRRNETDLFSQPLGFDQFIPSHFSAADADDDPAVFDHRFGSRR